jgi:hypothetical protein
VLIDLSQIPGAIFNQLTVQVPCDALGQWVDNQAILRFFVTFTIDDGMRKYTRLRNAYFYSLYTTTTSSTATATSTSAETSATSATSAASTSAYAPQQSTTTSAGINLSFNSSLLLFNAPSPSYYFWTSNVVSAPVLIAVIVALLLLFTGLAALGFYFWKRQKKQ